MKTCCVSDFSGKPSVKIGQEKFYRVKTTTTVTHISKCRKSTLKNERVWMIGLERWSPGNSAKWQN